MTLRHIIAIAVATFLWTGCEVATLESDADAGSSDTASAVEDSGSSTTEDTGGATDPGDPVPCDALHGGWYVTLCDMNAQTTNFVAAGCLASISSPQPELDGGAAHLDDDGQSLTLTLPGGVQGPFQCDATMSSATAFAGTCQGPTARCQVSGVKSW